MKFENYNEITKKDKVSITYPQQLEKPVVDSNSFSTSEPQNLNLKVLQENLANCLSIIDDEVMKGYVTRLDELPVIIQDEEVYESLNNIHFFKISELVYQEDEFSVDKISMVFHTLSNKPCTLVLMLRSNGEKTEFYLGVRPNDNRSSGTVFQMLKQSLLGFFPGSQISDYYDEDMKKDLQNVSVGCISSVTSVADYKQNQEDITNKEFIQGLEKFVYAMQGKSYTAIFLADNLSYEDIMIKKREYEKIYTQLSPFANMQINFSVNDSTSDSTGKSKGLTENMSFSSAQGSSQSITNTDTFTVGISKTKGKTETNTHTDNKSESDGKTHTTGSIDGSSHTYTKTESTSESTSKSTSKSKSKSKNRGVNILGGFNCGKSKTKTKTETKTNSQTKTNSESKSDTISHSESVSDAISNTISHGSSDSKANSTSTTSSLTVSNSIGKSLSDSVNNSETYSVGEAFNLVNTKTMTDTFGSSKGITLNAQNMTLNQTLQRLQIHLKRIEECESFGMWNFASYFIGETAAETETAANIYKSVVAGTNTSIERNAINSWHDEDSIEELMPYLSNFMHPQFVYTGFSYDQKRYISVNPSSLVSTNELAIHMGLPRHSVRGLPVVNHASFGQEVVSRRKIEKTINIGHIYNMGQITDTEVLLNLNSLTMHTFITGSTGSGKSNAVYHLLREIQKKGIPFLVVEPAKGEYKNVFKDVKCYGTNPLVGEILRINPFSFPKGIHVLEHIDRIVEIFNVCWPMYAAMPAVLKESIENSYKSAGWDLDLSINDKVDNLYPTFDDVLHELNKTINTSDYSSDTKGDYIGSLSTRIKSLTNGINGRVFVSNEMELRELYDKSAIIDISRVGSVETKSLIMGFVVMKLQEIGRASCRERVY